MLLERLSIDGINPQNAEIIKGSSGAWHLAEELGVGPVEIEELRNRRNESSSLPRHRKHGTRTTCSKPGGTKLLGHPE